MSSIIKISKVCGEEAEFVVGVECANEIDAEKLYNHLDNTYQVEPNYQNDYLVDLYRDDDLVSTFATTKAYAQEIDTLYFKKTG